MAFFGGNPFNTIVGQKIEQATDASLASENWALNMEICDIINETEDASRDAVKALRKRLQQNVGKNYTVVMYALIVLETCVKNCGRKFHLLATSKEFVLDLVKLIGPKNDPPTAVQEKVLSLIQTWADAFAGNPEMAGVVQVYQDLKQKGVEFPMTDLDALAPIHTPHRSVPEPDPVPHTVPMSRMVQAPEANQILTAVIPTGPVNLNASQMAKLRSELDMVQSNMLVFSEMLTELIPGQEHPSDLELLNELYRTLKHMQARVVELVDKVASEEVTVELLRVNDELNNVFLRHSRFEKNRAPTQNSQSPQVHADVHPSNAVAPLIDLGEPDSTPNLSSQLAGLGLGSESFSSALTQVNTVPSHNAEDEFDMFAQSRRATYETTKQSGSSYADNIHVDQVNVSLGAATQQRSTKLQKETDFDEMEAWLHEKPPNESELQQQQQGQQPITSVEFDRFLAERAAAVESSPNTNGTSRTGTRRQLNKDEQESSLFAL